MDKALNSITVVLLILGTGFFLGFMFVSAVVVPINVHHVEKQWCQSEGGTWIDNKCYEDTKEVKLK